jgi:hypothetical protein
VISLTIRGGRIVAIDILADVARVRKLDLSFLAGDDRAAT